jgi:hypothetical protein
MGWPEIKGAVTETIELLVPFAIAIFGIKYLLKSAS